MTKCTQNTTKAAIPTAEQHIFNHILTTANDAIAMYNKRQSMHFLLYCEEQLITLLPVAKLLTTPKSEKLADHIECTIDSLQRGEDIGQIYLLVSQGEK